MMFSSLVSSQMGCTCSILGEQVEILKRLSLLLNLVHKKTTEPTFENFCLLTMLLEQHT